MTPQLGARFGQHPSAFVEHGFVQRSDEEPVSRTYQYRKVMKPMLERKRRARINRCLDELKELMVTALQAEGENVAKLEKADILELTVRHLHGLRRQGRLIAGPEGSYAERFKAGFSHCASEVTQFITGATNTPRNTPAEAQAGERLLQHLNGCIRRLESTTPLMSSHQNVSPSADFLRGSSEGVRRLSSEGGGEGRRAYAPPSPPASPASSSEHAYSLWRPW